MRTNERGKPWERDCENPELCAACGGECCKRSPGKTWPSDWPDLRRALVSALLSTLWATDFATYDGGRIYFIRPAIRDHAGIVDAGCALSLKDRPWECRRLEPRMGGFGRGPMHCWGHGSQQIEK